MIRLDRHELLKLEKKILELRPEDFRGLPEKYGSFEPAYVGYHARRFSTLALILPQLGVTRESTILDVGPTFTAMFFHRELGCRVDGLSFSADEETPFGQNYQFDLNQTQWPDKWRNDLPKYEVIVFAEVIEHLYAAPQHALRYLGDHLKPGGYIVCQTPNALGLRKRVQLLLGKHPFDQINTDYFSPHHFRESTLRELEQFGREAGLEIAHSGHYNYFNPTYRQKQDGMPPWVGNLFFRLSDYLPGSMKPNCMVIYQRPK